ncbi:MAG: DegT/DnrJ/EryC1/StrS family aminotransferase [Candidatus Binatia bacterium]
MKIPLLDLKAQHATIRDEIERAIAEVFEEQQFVLGPAVERFERAMSEYTGARHAIGVASGSDALLLALMALGLGPRDCVVTTPFTFFATVSAITRVGARVAFADIDPATFNVSAETVARAIERGPAPEGRWVLLPVHLFGRVAPMEELGELARRRDAPVVEDAAQAVGARQAVGGKVRMAGTIGVAGALSFFPSKNLGGAGDGGMLLTDDDELAASFRILRVHGSGERYLHEIVGINSRLDAIQAAILSVKIRHLDDWNARRRDRAARYSRALREAGVAPRFVTPPVECAAEHVFHQYVVRAERRDELRSALTRAGIGTQIYYPLALHQQRCFADLGYREGDFPETERSTHETLALPIFPELSDDQIDAVVSAITSFYRKRSA